VLGEYVEHLNGRDDLYDLYYGKLNRCVFNDSQGHDCIFVLK
jgi:hypothetical protein